MINEKETFEKFGYKSTDLTPKSNKKIIAVCNICGKKRESKKIAYKKLCKSCSHKGKHHSNETIKKISIAQSGKNHHMFGNHLSEETKRKMSISISGENHYNWNSNLTDEERKNGRSYPEYKLWREMIFKHDLYTCQICGEHGGKLNAHHLESYATNPELRTNLKNGITLCENCHKKFHYQYGMGNNTNNQFINFKTK